MKESKKQEPELKKNDYFMFSVHSRAIFVNCA